MSQSKFWEEAQTGGVKKIKVKVRPKGQGPEECRVEEFTCVEAAVQFFTVRDPTGKLIEEGESHVLKLINKRHRRNRMDRARSEALRKSGKGPRRRSKADPELLKKLNELLDAVGLPELKD